MMPTALYLFAQKPKWGPYELRNIGESNVDWILPIAVLVAVVVTSATCTSATRWN